MKIITSPAKLMNVENSTDFLKSTTPKFIEEAAFIQSYLKHKSPKYLSELMEISSKLADENWERNQKWKAKPTAKESAPALFAFTGEVYRAWMPKHSIKKPLIIYRKITGCFPDCTDYSNHPIKSCFTGWKWDAILNSINIKIFMNSGGKKLLTSLIPK
ncbi:hypothetical protein BN1195_01341 [Chryseobacterium oranimense G311]|nr:hypothetical protein BN1195_01341 [Chryseobacterium oranimense G311]